MSGVQRPCDLPRITRIAGGSCHFAVRRDSAFGNFPDRVEQIAEHTRRPLSYRRGFQYLGANERKFVEIAFEAGAQFGCRPVVGGFIPPHTTSVQHLGRHVGARLRHHDAKDGIRRLRDAVESPESAAFTMALVYESFIRAPTP